MQVGFGGLDCVLDAAVEAGRWLSSAPLDERAQLLDTVADALDDAVEDLVSEAGRETSLAADRLRGEVARTSHQLRLFGEVVREGAFLNVCIDRAGPTAPELRRMSVPVGPVVVFAAGNFPFAFGALGTDTAAALAAGCSVLLKEHPGYPKTARATLDVAREALTSRGAPAGLVGLVHGDAAGRAAVQDHRVAAVAFTGSTRAGLLLADLAARRSTPIPFYGELGSLNPVIVTTGAGRRRGATLVTDFLASVSASAGQLCTKPGLLLLARGHGLTADLVAQAGTIPRQAMLNERGRAQFATGVAALVDGGAEPLTEPDQSGALLLRVPLQTLRSSPALLDEVFGPVSLVADYDDAAELLDLVGTLPGQLTCTLHAEDDELDHVLPLVRALESRCGRLVWNGMPTGVRVGWATHHGGPFPAATSASFSSVGAQAVQRFLRPVCYQDAPDVVLPPALRHGNPSGLPRRVDGRLEPVG